VVFRTGIEKKVYGDCNINKQNDSLVSGNLKRKASVNTKLSEMIDLRPLVYNEYS
jgi:hypothetical protein